MNVTRTRKTLRVALVGTRGVPARYGGFETAMEEVGRRLAQDGHHVTVYCRSGNSGESPEPCEYLGMRLIHLPALKKRSLETLSHTFLTALHMALSQQRFDAIIVCNAANSPVLPLLRLGGAAIAVHVDGLEWRRTKWGPIGRKFYRVAESLAVRWSDALIADAYGIERYYEDEFGAHTEGIAYGAPDMTLVGSNLLASVGVKEHQYHLCVARFEPENHVDLMVEGYLRSTTKYPLLVVGSTPYPGAHSERIEMLAARSSQVHLLGGVWDQRLLDQLYAGALTYLHGHSVGGTNPSLLRAMGAGSQTIAYDVVFNREVAGPTAFYCSSAGEVGAAISEAEEDIPETLTRGSELAARARRLYTWDKVAQDYAALCQRLASGFSQRGLFTGRRSKNSAWRAGRTPWIATPEESSRLGSEPPTEVTAI